MPKYPMRFRVWGLLTAVLATAYLAWEHRAHRRDSLWGAYRDLALGKEDLSDAGSVAAFTAKLALAAGLSAWIVYASATILALVMSHRPRSEQTADYDDSPPPRSRF
jgi:hypothetical protein